MQQVSHLTDGNVGQKVGWQHSITYRFGNEDEDSRSKTYWTFPSKSEAVWLRKG